MALFQINLSNTLLFFHSIIKNYFMLILFHFQETINQYTPIESADNVPSTSTRRITRYQQSILEKSLQSTSIIE